MNTIKVRDRYKNVERITIIGPGYVTEITLPKSLAKKLRPIKPNGN